MTHKHFTFLLLGVLCILLLALHSGTMAAEQSLAAQASTIVASVEPRAETDPVRGSPDSADDMAIWVHPSNPALSTVIGTDKGNGLFVYDLSGQQLQYLAVGGTNNVDVRYNFPLTGQQIDLVGASNRKTNSLAFYQVDPQTRQLKDISARLIVPSITVYGFCMYHSIKTDTYYAFVTKHYAAAPTSRGEVQQWKLFATSSGKVDAKLVRTLTNVGSSAEGCVADDEQGNLYVADGKGLWQFGAEPSAGATSTHIVAVGGNVSNSLEGVTLYYTSQGAGYLILSDQGNSVYHLYRREGAHAYVGTFQIVASSTIDGTSDTDGIDVTSVNLGPSFPQGLFVAQDNPDTPETTSSTNRTDFKLVGWDAIAQSFTPSLTTDTTWNPRSSNAPVSTVTSNTPTATSTNTATPTRTPTVTITPTNTATPTHTPAATTTPTNVPTSAPTTPMEAPTITETSTEEPLITPTAGKEVAASNVVMWLPMLMQ